MSFSMYSASLPVFQQILNSLLEILDKAERHVETTRIDPNALLQYRLFPDMLPFTRQIQIAADFAKGAGARLAGQDVPAYEDTEKTFADLQQRGRIDLLRLDVGFGLGQDGRQAVQNLAEDGDGRGKHGKRHG